MKQISARQKGITFIESLVWVAVFVVSMMALIVSLLSFYKANTYTLAQAGAVSDARRSIEHVVQELREATYASDGAYPIAAMSTSSVVFYANIDDDALVERVHYYISGSELRKGILKPTGSPLSYTGSETDTLISPYIRNVEQAQETFTYYDPEGAVIADYTDIAAVRFVRVDVVVNISPDKLPNELTVRSSATLRNLTGL